MKLALWSCLAGVVLLTPQRGVSESVVLPPSVRSTLDSRYPGWAIAPVNDAIRDFLHSRGADATPNLIAGDFDGNGRVDYAVIIERSAPSAPMLEFLAFMEERAAFRLFVLKQPVPVKTRRDRHFFLTLQKKGARGHDLDAGTDLIYPNDSIGVWFFGVAGGTYIFERGRFRFVSESD